MRRHRFRSLTGPRQVIGWALLVLAAVPALASAVLALHRGWLPVGDNALIGLRITSLLHGHLPLVGQPTAGENFAGGVATSHPGPIEFYLFAPLAPLLGVRLALLIGAASVNGSAMATAAWVAFRRGGLVCMGWLTVVMLLTVRSLSANLLHDPLSSSIGTTPTLLLAVLAWAVVAGDEALLPLFAVVATFVVQDHLVYLPLGGALVLWVAGATAFQAFRVNRADQGAGRPRATELRRTGWSLAALIFAGVCWVPVAIQQATGHPGNLGALWRTFTHNNPAATAATAATGPSPGRLTFALGRLAYTMAPPTILRPVATTSFLTDRHGLAYAVGLVLVGAVGLGAWLVGRAGRRELALLAWTTLVVFGAGAASTVALPEGARLQATNLRWMWIASAMAVFTAGWAAWSLLRVRLSLPSKQACTALLAISAVTAVVTVHGTRTNDERDFPTFAPLGRFGSPFEGLGGSRYRVDFSGVGPTTTIGPAIVANLVDHGVHPLVEAAAGVADGYEPYLRYHDQSTAGTIWVTNGPAPGPYAQLIGRFTYRPLATQDEMRNLAGVLRGSLASGAKLTILPAAPSPPAHGSALAPPPNAATATHSPDLGRWLLEGTVRIDGANALVVGRLEQLAGPAGQDKVSIYLDPTPD
ncbi:MAG TPA: hypothetical protein VGM93_11110 [Acidimicrobiales bacterium]